MTKFVSDIQLADRYSVSRCTIWRWTGKGILPAPLQLSPGCTRWDLGDIEKRDQECSYEPRKIPKSAKAA